MIASLFARKRQQPTAEVSSEQTLFTRLDRAPFLQNQQQQSTAVQRSIVRDPTSDFAKLARRGSESLRTLKFERDQNKARDRVWDVADSRIGKLTGESTSSSSSSSSSRPDEDDDSGHSHMQYLSYLKNDAESIDSTAIQRQRESLPIFTVRAGLMQFLRENNIVILVGETGSGKTTQLTQYCLEEGYARAAGGKDGGRQMIGCTQPRRVAAMSVAKRVSEELGCQLGDKVSYAIRFDDVTTSSTVIRYMTDGILLRESLRDPDFSNYSVIIMDEAHERSLNTDLLFGILKRVMMHRRDLKLIITSATLNADHFSKFFGGAPVFTVPGRTYEVTTFYSRSIPDDYVEAAVRQILSLHLGPPGDILVFMTGETDIEATCELAAARWEKVKETLQKQGQDANEQPADELLMLPLYSQMHAELQTRIFASAPKGHRKCIVASNIAETSLTIDGIRYVIDSGLCKVKLYNPRVGMDLLEVVPVSRANADQRMGRAGRTGPGSCYRLYTDTAYVHDMHDTPIPEIQRTHLAHVVLLLQSLGVDNLFDFPFMDPPPHDNLASSLQQLWIHKALDDHGKLTELGHRLVDFPLDTSMAKMLLVAQQLDCTEEILTVVAMLSVQPIFYRPKNDAERSDLRREKFAVPEADHLTLLNVYSQWEANRRSRKWCTENFIHAKSMQRVGAIREQLRDIATKSNIALKSAGSNWDAIRECVCAGYFHHAAKFKGIGEYVSLIGGMSCYIHPQSSLFNQAPSLIVYHELLMTTKEYVSVACEVTPAWLAKYGSLVFSQKPFTASQPRQQAQTATVATPQTEQTSTQTWTATTSTTTTSATHPSRRRRRLI